MPMQMDRQQTAGIFNGANQGCKVMLSWDKAPTAPQSQQRSRRWLS